MIDHAQTLISLLLIVYIIWREQQAIRERAHMADRLLARHLPEYQLAKKDIPLPDAHPLTDAVEYEREQQVRRQVTPS